jgi:ankyrin repeat protein
MTEKLLNSLAHSGKVQDLKMYRFRIMRPFVRGKRFQVTANEALLRSSNNGDEEGVISALARGASTRCFGKKAEQSLHPGEYPITLASQQGHLEILDLLLQAKETADVNVRNLSGWTPLCLACREGHLNIVTKLVDSIVDSHDIFLATTKGKTPLMCASRSGHVDIVQFLLKKGAAIELKSQRGWKSLHHAVSNGHSKVTNALFCRGANATSKSVSSGQSVLSVASRSGKVDIVVDVLKHISKQENPVQKTFTQRSSPNYVMPINAVDKEDKSALHIACSYNSLGVVRVLLANGANKNAIDNMGETPLITAAKEGNDRVVRILLENKCSTEFLCNNGWTALMWACSNKHVGAAKLLNPANIEAADRIAAHQRERGFFEATRPSHVHNDDGL